MAVIFVIGTFVFYAVAVIRSHQEEAYRQTFRGLHLISHDISGNLETLKPILATLLPDPNNADLKSDFIRKKLDDLHKTLGYQGLAVSPTPDSSSPCRQGVEDEVVISAFNKSVVLIDCRTEIAPCSNGDGAKCRLQATIPVASLVDSSYVRGLVDAVLIADSRGVVRSEADSQTFAHLTSVAPNMRANGDNDKNSNGAQASATDIRPETQSTIRPTKLSGENFLLFIQPQMLPLPTADTSPGLFYVVGILKEPGFLDNLSNLPVAMVWAFLGLLAVLAISMPVIKLGLIGADEKLHPR